MIISTEADARASHHRPRARSDDRGFFARTFCREEFEDAGLEPRGRQGNLSFNHRAGTLRGMHFQVGSAAETKLVRCTARRHRRRDRGPAAGVADVSAQHVASS